MAVVTELRVLRDRQLTNATDPELTTNDVGLKAAGNVTPTTSTKSTAAAIIGHHWRSSVYY